MPGCRSHPHYAVGVWVGNATGEGKPSLVGARTAGPVLFDVFSLLPPTRWFKRPGVFVKAEVCRKSGHLKGRFCEETDTLLILPAGLKTEACPYHHLITLSADETHRIYENCANLEPTIQKSGSLYHLYGNGITNNIIRNTIRFLPSKQAAERMHCNPCNSSIHP